MQDALEILLLPVSQQQPQYYFFEMFDGPIPERIKIQGEDSVPEETIISLLQLTSEI